MVIATLLLGLAVQDTENVSKGLVHRETLDEAQKEYARAQQLAEQDPKAALDLIERVFTNPRVGTKDRRIAFVGAGGVRTVDFFPHQARGRIELILATGMAKNDPAGALKLVGLAISDLKSSVDSGVKASEKMLANAEELQKELQRKPRPAAPAKAPEAPKETRKEPTKDTAAEQVFRESWFKLIEDHRFKTAREFIDAKGGSLAPDKRGEFISETEAHCQKFVQDALKAFFNGMHGAHPLELRGKGEADYQRDFAIPPDSEVVGAFPALDWCRRERSALDRLRRIPPRAKVEEAMPVLEELLGAMGAAVPLVRTGETRGLKESWQLAYWYVEEILRGLVATGASAPAETRRECRASADQVRARWMEAISKIPRDVLVQTSVHGHAKQIQAVIDLFPVDPSDLDKMDVDACFTSDSPDQALEQLISDLTRLRENVGSPLSKEAKQKLLTSLIAATAMRDLLAGKGLEEVTRGVADLGKALGQAGGAVDPGRWGPKIEKILSTGP